MPRHANDFYETPSWCVDRLLEAVCLPSGLWLEPAVGNGAIITAVGSKSTIWYACDLISPPVHLPTAHFHVGDFLKWDVKTRFNVCITNPPYSLAMEFVEKCFYLADYVVMLLRLNFLASAKRATFMRQFPPDVYVLPNRPDFTGCGGDSTEYAWMLWGTHKNCGEPWWHGTLQVLNETPKDARRHSRSATTEAANANNACLSAHHLGSA